MDIAREIERLKSEGEYFAAGKLAGAWQRGPEYGCHFGMRSTYEIARAQFRAGHDEARREIEIGRRAAVNKAIASSRPKIGKREARAIHALLAPRKWER